MQELQTLLSRKREQEAALVFKQALSRWPHERQVRDLADLLIIDTGAASRLHLDLAW